MHDTDIIGWAARGCRLTTTRDGRSEWAFNQPFVIRETSVGSGMGAFAIRGVKLGECILSERPLVQWTLHPGEKTTAGLVSLVNALTPTDHATYSGLCQNPMHGVGSKSVYGIWLSNAYPCTSPLQAARDRQSGVGDISLETTKAVYASACRFNHSCSPNAHASWNAKQGVQVIYALHDIAPGVEISVSYLDNASGMRRAQRHGELGFECRCATCELRGASLAQSDHRRSRTGVIFGLLEASIRAGDRRAIGLISERLSLMAQEEVREDWNTLYMASSYFALAGDRRQASMWAARAAERARHGLGTDSDEYQHYKARGECLAG